ncbi:hypothetical protein JCM8097_001200 [Rhodosporidiobolus ruineniae]
MSFLWGASAPVTEFDSLTDKVTSDLLPAGEQLDLATALQLADLVRSSAVPPQHANKHLLARLTHSNPNTQLLALALADLLVKNAGSQFLALFAQPAHKQGAATDLELLASGRKAGGVNRDVQTDARKRLQEWASALKGSGRADLKSSELVEVYDRLKRDGVEFPLLDREASAAMVESLSAPDWLDSDVCTRCRTPFTTFNRKHHCRNCGLVFDQACSSQTAALPHYGITDPVRVCDACARKIKEGKGASVAKEQEEERRKKAAVAAKEDEARREAASSAVGGGGAGKSSREQEDDDLRRAIEASLADSAEPAPRSPPPPAKSGYNPAYAQSVSDSKGAGGKKAEAEEEEDPDLAAAIAASLRDLAPPASAPYLARTSSSSTVGGGGPGEALTYAQLFPSSSSGYAASSYSYSTSDAPAPPSKAPGFTLPNYDLPPSSRQLLESFSAPSAVSSPYFAHQRAQYDQVRADAEPRLQRSLEDTRRRLALLREMEWKLGEAARIYGAGLTERASYQPTPSRAASYAHPVPPMPIQPAPLDARYVPQRTASYGLAAGQPLPAYAVPPAQAHPAIAAPAPPVPAVAQPQPQPVHAPPQAQQQQQHAQPQPAGFYKPSQFPSVPSALPPTALASLPAAPSGWGAEREEEEEEEEEGAREPVKEAELISF